AEHALLPRLRRAEPGTAIIASGFSCREQIEQLSGRKTHHVAEAVAEALGVLPPPPPPRGLDRQFAIAAGAVTGGIVLAVVISRGAASYRAGKSRDRLPRPVSHIAAPPASSPIP